MKKRTQVLIVHGGMTFKSTRDYLHYLKTRKISIGKRVRWSGEYLEKKLGSGFQIIRPRMPLQDNAKYTNWRIWFERHLPYIKKNSIFIGSSLGGIFLAKYLSEHKLRREALSTYLICPPFDNSVKGEHLGGDFKLKSDLSLLEKNTKNLRLLFSKDDDVVPVTHAGKYKAKLKNAHIVIYKNKNGHFQVSAFPEIIKMIKGDVRGT